MISGVVLMRHKILAISAACVVLLGTTEPAKAGKNSMGGWVLHIAGTHDSSAHTCAFNLDDACGVVTDETSTPNRFDIYVIAADVGGIAKARFGLYGIGRFYFYGSTMCTDSAVGSDGWPGCGEAIELTWVEEQPGPYVTLGILDVYVYGEAQMWIGPDPRVGFTEFCDGSQPEAKCDSLTSESQREAWARVAFGGYGYGCIGCFCLDLSPQCRAPGFDLEVYGSCDCDPVSVSSSSWGAIKALYK